MILNSLPKSGSNLITTLFQINGINSIGSISPTRFLKFNRNLPLQYLSKGVLSNHFYKIGYEIDAYVEHRSIKKYQEDQSLIKGAKFVPSHFSNQKITQRLKASGLRSVYTIRNPVDVYFSYLRYCIKEPNHTFFKHISQIGLNRFSEKLLYGGTVGNFELLGWDEVLQRAIDQALISDYVFDYSKYCENGLPVLQELATQISDTTNVRLPNIEESQISGMSHTFKIGGNKNYKKKQNISPNISEARKEFSSH